MPRTGSPQRSWHNIKERNRQPGKAKWQSQGDGNKMGLLKSMLCGESWKGVEGNGQVFFSRSRGQVSYLWLTLWKSPHHQLKAHRHLLRAGAAEDFLIHNRNTVSPVSLNTLYYFIWSSWQTWEIDKQNVAYPYNGKWIILPPFCRKENWLNTSSWATQ